MILLLLFLLPLASLLARVSATNSTSTPPDSTLLIESCLSVALIPVTLNDQCEMIVPDYVGLQENRTLPPSNPVVQRPPANTVKRGRGPHAIAFTSKGEAPCITHVRPVESGPPSFAFLRAVPSHISVPPVHTSEKEGPNIAVRLEYAIADSCGTGEEMRCKLALERVFDQNDNEIFPSHGRTLETDETKRKKKKRSVKKQSTSSSRGRGGEDVESKWWKVIDSHQALISGSMKGGYLAYEISVSCLDDSGVSVEDSVQVKVESEGEGGVKGVKDTEEGEKRIRKRRWMEGHGGSEL